LAKRFVAAVTAALVYLLAAAAVAQTTRDLYTASVPVADQGSRALQVGAREALSEVLVKVSGSHEVLQMAPVVEALGEARQHVQQYAYQRREGEGEDDTLWARYEFDPGYVTALVVDAGAPLWTANRPPVLAWVVAEGPSGRYFIADDRTPQQARLLREAFARRGVTLQFPLFDLADTAALPPDTAWRLDGLALRAASDRYAAQHIVAGRLAAVSAGGVVGDWSYFSPDDRLDRAVSATDAEDFARQGAAIVAATMAARYAVAPSLGGDQGLRMSVSGVTAYADYAAIVSWLESLELVDRANVEHVAGERVELRLWARAEAAQLATLIELNERLQPVPAAAGGALLSYRWLHQ